MSKKRKNNTSDFDALLPQDDYADNVGFSRDDADDLDEPYSQENLNFDRDNRWELDEDEAIRGLMRNISAKVNKRGENDIYMWFKMNFIKSFALSNLDDKIINMYVMDAANTFNREALLKMRTWDLKSSDLPTLSLWIREAIHIFLRRSYKDGERKHRTSRYGGVNDQTDYGDHTKGDFSLGSFFGGNKNKPRQEPRKETNIDENYESEMM